MLRLLLPLLPLLPLGEGQGSEGSSSLVNDLARREVDFVFVGGKGGVGKTSTSSSVAVQLALQKKVLLLSTDPAHSLGDAFRLPAGQNFLGQDGEPVRQSVPRGGGGEEASLDVLELDPPTILEKELAGWKEVMLAVDPNADPDEMIGEVKTLLAGMPGLDEAMALVSAVKLVESGRYDTIVFDTAPTGHTVKLLQLPGLLAKLLTKVESMGGKLWAGLAMFSPSASRKLDGKKLLESKLRTLREGIERVGAMMRDRQKTRFVTVCIAESLSVNESKRLLAELEKHGVRASHVVVNQLLPGGEDEEAAGEYPDRVLQKLRLYDARRRTQQRYLAELKRFPGLPPVTEVPLLAEEVTGVQRLLDFGRFFTGAASSEPAEGDGATSALDELREKQRLAAEAPAKPKADIGKLMGQLDDAGLGGVADALGGADGMQDLLSGGGLGDIVNQLGGMDAIGQMLGSMSKGRKRRRRSKNKEL